MIGIIMIIVLIYTLKSYSRISVLVEDDIK